MIYLLSNEFFIPRNWYFLFLRLFSSVWPVSIRVRFFRRIIARFVTIEMEGIERASTRYQIVLKNDFDFSLISPTFHELLSSYKISFELIVWVFIFVGKEINKYMHLKYYYNWLLYVKNVFFFLVLPKLEFAFHMVCVIVTPDINYKCA